MSSSHNNYARPPVVETVVEIIYDRAVNIDALQDVADRLDKTYPNKQQDFVNETNIDLTAQKVSVNNYIDAWRITSSDQTELLLLKQDRLVFAQLAPYPGWTVFIDRIKRDMAKIKDKLGHRVPIRIGVRAINRLDIPIELFPLPQPSEFFVFGPNPPTYGDGKLKSFVMMLESGILNTKFNSRVSVASATPPVPKTSAFVLDIDVSLEQGLPVRDQDLLECLEDMRTHKNRIFESIITDSARSLFQ